MNLATLLLVVLACASAFSCRAAQIYPSSRPNILFIMSDDHAAHAISCYGSAVNETPHMDRLAKEGMRLNRCFAVNSICTPSRASILTGKYSHLNGVPVFNRFDGSQPTVAKYLQVAGYHTGMIGKWHLGSDPTGFDKWKILPGQGLYFDPVFISPQGRQVITGYVNNQKRAKKFIKKAVNLKTNANRWEAMWIEALNNFYKGVKAEDKVEPTYSSSSTGTTNVPQDSSRHREFVRALENIVEEFPDDIEAKAFLAFKIWDNNGKGLKITSHTAADAIAREVLAVNPMHAVHHYRIHLWNDEKDRRALNSAALCGQSSPGIAHMWHMPGHTYSKLHRYADAAWQQEASARVDHAHMMRDGVLPDQIHNYAHNNEWLARNLSYVGRVHDAIDLAKNLIELPHHPKYNTLTKFISQTNTAPITNYERRESSAGLGRGRLLDLLVRYELWNELIGLGRTTYLEPTTIPEEQVKRLRALGVAYFRKGDLKNGDKQIAAAEKALKQQKELRQLAVDEAEAKARKEKQPDDKVAKALTDVLMAGGKRMRTTEAAIAEMKLYRALATDEKEIARSLLDETKDIPKERLALIHFELGDKDKAEKLAREAVSAGTNQVQLLANLAHILWRNDNETEAKQMFERLRNISGHVDLDIPAFQRVKTIARDLELPQDWRVTVSSASDTGKRPPLNDLGPFRWQPSPAPEWSLNDSDGKQYSLSQFRGNPVIVIFYLGYGCVHCLEQLNAFAPMTKRFAEAGISILAITTDTAEGLKKTLSKSETAFPFPLLSDHDLRVFKLYRAYDDFENMPLHGTFLIDGNGLVRWQDINFEPFIETNFLLAESKRLLGLPVQHIASARPNKAPGLSKKSQKTAQLP